MAITPLNGDLTAGVAGQSSDIIDPSANPFFTGDAPQPAAFSYPLPANAVLAAHTVVGFDANGRIIPAVLGTTAAIGITVYACDATGKANDAEYVGVYRMGVFNPDLCVWGATYDTDAKKRKAFEGAPTPTAIFIVKPTTMTV